jgi:hypothetical protein
MNRRSDAPSQEPERQTPPPVWERHFLQLWLLLVLVVLIGGFINFLILRWRG